MFRRGRILAAIGVAALAGSVPIGGAQAGTLTVLYAFGSHSGDGTQPYAGVTADKAGNLYGTTFLGGSDIKGCWQRKRWNYGCGTIFKVTQSGTETILFDFSGSLGGRGPDAGLLADKNGNLYGTTLNNSQFYRLSKDGKESTLFKFNDDSGNSPSGDIARDKLGNFFGATQLGGSGPPVCSGYACGTVYQLTPNGDFTVLYNFSGGNDGSTPKGGLTIDNSGNLYGTTSGGGAFGDGTVFKILPSGSESVLYSFSGGTDGANPIGGVIMDESGNVYGTTISGGSGDCEAGCGTVFKITPDGTETLLHSFKGGTDGVNPIAGLVMDKAGNLYGTTDFGGGTQCQQAGCGTIFKVSQKGFEKILHAFSGLDDGAYPAAALIIDKSGDMYGTTENGGTYSGGVVFKFSP